MFAVSVSVSYTQTSGEDWWCRGVILELLIIVLGFHIKTFFCMRFIKIAFPV